MSKVIREKFSSQAAPEVLAALRLIADSQGRQFQAVLEEALRDYIDRQQNDRPRRHVMGSFASSVEAADVFLRINGWRLRRPPLQIHAEMIEMLEAGTFDIAHLEPWLRDFASAAE